MKVETFKKLIKEAIREVLEEEYQLPKKQHQDISPKEVELVKETKSFISEDPIQNALMSTKKEFSKLDYSNFILNENAFTEQPTNVHSSTGLDLSTLDFVKKASTVLKKSYEIDNRKVI